MTLIEHFDRIADDAFVLTLNEVQAHQAWHEKNLDEELDRLRRTPYTPNRDPRMSHNDRWYHR